MWQLAQCTAAWCTQQQCYAAELLQLNSKCMLTSLADIDIAILLVELSTIQALSGPTVINRAWHIFGFLTTVAEVHRLVCLLTYLLTQETICVAMNTFMMNTLMTTNKHNGTRFERKKGTSSLTINMGQLILLTTSIYRKAYQNLKKNLSLSVDSSIQTRLLGWKQLHWWLAGYTLAEQLNM